MTKPRGYTKRTIARATRPQPHDDEGAQFAPERYPAPSYAATIWYTPQGLRIGLPAALGEPGHTVVLPFMDAAWTVLTEILRERARSSERAQRVIGTRSAPVQYDIEGILRAMGSSAPAPRRIERTRTLTLQDLDEEAAPSAE